MGYETSHILTLRIRLKISMQKGWLLFITHVFPALFSWMLRLQLYKVTPPDFVYQFLSWSNNTCSGYWPRAWQSQQCNFLYFYWHISEHSRVLPNKDLPLLIVQHGFPLEKALDSKVQSTCDRRFVLSVNFLKSRWPAMITYSPFNFRSIAIG